MNDDDGDGDGSPVRMAESLHEETNAMMEAHCNGSEPS